MSQHGLIMRSTGSWYEIFGDDHAFYKGRLRGKFKIQEMKITNPVAVGDRVVFEKEKESNDTVLITEILPRKNYIIRKSVHKTAHGHMIAANIDQSILIVTLIFPKTSLGFIDRFLVSSEAFRIPAVLVFNKADLHDDILQDYQEEIISTYESIGYKCIVASVKTGQGIEEVRGLLHQKKSLLSGHSGVGKSSIINRIAPDLNLKTTEVSTFANKGVHTTTFAEMFELEPGTFIIDTPGIKELGIFEIGQDELGHYFPEMRNILGLCKFNNCRHVNEPGCAVISLLEKGDIPLSRYESYLSMLDDYDNRR